MFAWAKRLFPKQKQTQEPCFVLDPAGERLQNRHPDQFSPVKTSFLEETDEDSNQAMPGMITRTCKRCGKTFTLPENVQHWPTYCQECRAKYQPVEMITRRCKGCKKDFTFPSNAPQWLQYCPECQGKRG